MYNIVIDRFEGDIAVCESDSGEIFEISKKELPENAKEGSVVKKDDFGYTLLESETADRKERMQSRLNQLFGR